MCSLYPRRQAASGGEAPSMSGTFSSRLAGVHPRDTRAHAMSIECAFRCSLTGPIASSRAMLGERREGSVLDLLLCLRRECDRHPDTYRDQSRKLYLHQPSRTPTVERCPVGGMPLRTVRSRRRVCPEDALSVQQLRKLSRGYRARTLFSSIPISVATDILVCVLSPRMRFP